MKSALYSMLIIAAAISLRAGTGALIAHQQLAQADGSRRAATTSTPAATPLTKHLVSSGFDAPVLVTHAPYDSSRIFVVDQDGQILICKGDTLLTRPFLNISTRITYGGERGLLGLAFHPNYDSNGYFYVNYTDNSGGDTRISRFTVSSDPDSAVATSESILIEIDQPFSNHNGGMIAFDEEGYLMVGMGDGGDAGDPQDRAQNPQSLLGKMLRLDVDNHPTPPPTNPYVGNVDTLEYIWAMGVRNPWRFSFDRVTNDLYIADVGQGNWEEVDIEPGASTGKVNYGWDNREGKHCYEPALGCITSGMTEPVHEYSHSFGCSISGGNVYRGCAIPDLDGAYFFGDYCSGRLWTFKYVGGMVTELTERTSEIGTSSLSIVGFGEDAAGEVYICDLGGSVYKIVPNGVPSQCSVGGCCTQRGEIDGLGIINILDVNKLVSYLFAGGSAPVCEDHADVDGSGSLNILDVNRLVSYLFAAGMAPAAC